MSDKEQVLEAMKKAGKPVRPGDLAKELGLESKAVSKIIADLKKRERFTPPKDVITPRWNKQTRGPFGPRCKYTLILRKGAFSGRLPYCAFPSYSFGNERDAVMDCK